MIPKIIHYCWLGGKPLPRKHQKYIKSWKKHMPDYQIKCWNEENFDIKSNKFIHQAYNSGKYAFVADYIRLYALYTEGGIYLDTDVKVLKSFNPYLNYSFISSIEYHPIKDIWKYITKDGKRISSFDNFGISIHSAIIGAEKKCQYIKDCLDYYDNIEFNGININANKTIPVVLALHAEKYGLKYLNQNQLLQNNIMIYSSDIFSEYRTISNKSVAIHYCEGSWVHKSLIDNIKNYFKRFNIIYKLYKIIK